ncbi:MAG: family hydrolase [Labilithrix sp.]|jgi:phosphonatase-like hydrolase|nr:family hydrolase [Labilithrix sp.]
MEEDVVMQSPSPALVVFDLAGTTIEDHDIVARCLVEATHAVGVTIDLQQANSVMGLPKPVAIAQLLAKHDGLPIAPIDSARVVRANAVFEQTILRHYSSPGAVVPISGVEETLDALHRQDVKIAIDTGFSAVVVDAILDRLGWITDGLVDARVASDEVRRGRPAPDLLVEAMRRCGVTDARKVAKVGDTPADLGEGANAGCGWNVGVTYGTHSRAELADRPHTVLIDDIRELLGVLGLERLRPIERGPAVRRMRPASGA